MATTHTPDDGLMAKYIAREFLRACVMRQIFCPYAAKAVLDITSAVLLDATDGPTREVGMVIMCGECYTLAKDAISEAYPEGTFTVYDGAILYGRQKLPKPHRLT